MLKKRSQAHLEVSYPFQKKQDLGLHSDLIGPGLSFSSPLADLIFQSRSSSKRGVSVAAKKKDHPKGKRGGTLQQTHRDANNFQPLQGAIPDEQSKQAVVAGHNLPPPPP